MYENGLSFSSGLDENVKDLLKRISINKASLMIIDGGVGEGKTTLAVHIGDYYNELNGQGPLDFKKQLARGGADFLQKLRVCYAEKLPVCIYDESGDFNRRGALTAFNAMLNRTFETFRAFKVLIILVLPSFKVLDNDLFDKQIPRLLLHCDKRTEDYGNYKGFSLYRMFYIKQKMEKLTVKPFAYNLVEPNFYGHFLDLTPERAKELDVISTKGKLSILKKAEIQIEGLIGYSDIARKVGRSVVWCRIEINKLKIKPDRIIGMQRYFKNDIVNILADRIEIKKWYAATAKRK